MHIKTTYTKIQSVKTKFLQQNIGTGGYWTIKRACVRVPALGTDLIIFHIYLFVALLLLEKTESKRKRDREWPI